MHSRRARPTLRLIAEDLTADWASPLPRRQLADGRLDDLHPLAELPHPIILKAAEAFPHDGPDNPIGDIECSSQPALMEVKVGQWRGGVWLDAHTGVHWLLIAGLAKGGHVDRDDFYQRIERATRDGASIRWLPTQADVRLLKRETVARILTEWELVVQRDLATALRQILGGDTARVEVSHPILTGTPLGVLEITLAHVDEDDYQADELTAEILPAQRFIGSGLIWQLTTRALITLNPPVQEWDRYRDLYSTINVPGYFDDRVATLEELARDGSRADAEPGQYAHYIDHKHLAGSTIEGRAVRALCGAHFVPTQDHETLPRCPPCEQRLSELPPATGS